MYFFSLRTTLVLFMSILHTFYLELLGWYFWSNWRIDLGSIIVTMHSSLIESSIPPHDKLMILIIKKLVHGFIWIISNEYTLETLDQTCCLILHHYKHTLNKKILLNEIEIFFITPHFISKILFRVIEGLLSIIHIALLTIFAQTYFSNPSCNLMLLTCFVMVMFMQYTTPLFYGVLNIIKSHLISFGA